MAHDSTERNRLLSKFVKQAFRGGVHTVDQWISHQRNRMETKRQQKNLEHFWIRLGKTAYHLNRAGELDHPAIQKATKRIEIIQTSIYSPNITQ